MGHHVQELQRKRNDKTNIENEIPEMGEWTARIWPSEQRRAQCLLSFETFKAGKLLSAKCMPIGLGARRGLHF